MTVMEYWWEECLDRSCEGNSVFAGLGLPVHGTDAMESSVLAGLDYLKYWFEVTHRRNDPVHGMSGICHKEVLRTCKAKYLVNALVKVVSTLPKALVGIQLSSYVESETAKYDQPTTTSVRIRTNKYNVAWPLPRAISAKQVSIWETAQAGKMATRSLSKCALATKVDPFKTSASFDPSPTIHPSHNQTIPIFNLQCRQFQIAPKLSNIPSNLKPHTQLSVWAPSPLTAPPPPLPPWLTNPAPMTIDVTLKREPGSSGAPWDLCLLRVPTHSTLAQHISEYPDRQQVDGKVGKWSSTIT
ncbi:hypothetical protein DFH08DRAFT_797540 [Mycena albidolilacea]|uniref:Uncharacterized protein n=1 Tax=Mycena albidolilacea TaxID=1033008 RepID=A0AAD7ARI5_9AGAR|nr:hypothetical protein DFH08DRAFT_797540 [Mycena albidolilacea]